MTIKLDVPEDRLGAFQRMKRQLPLEIREDAQVLRRLLVYLKLGGERLVRQYVAALKTDFPDDTLLFKRRGIDEGMDESEGEGEDADANGSIADGTDPEDADD